MTTSVSHNRGWSAGGWGGRKHGCQWSSPVLQTQLLTRVTLMKSWNILAASSGCNQMFIDSIRFPRGRPLGKSMILYHDTRDSWPLSLRNSNVSFFLCQCTTQWDSGQAVTEQSMVIDGLHVWT